ncbi:Cytochrome P450 [Metarhizium album ARSEF 1941]|uniref:Cytochrome P450 n=1 Tax=Metarhizium album (strain ARSEF 1941) TaxID=1081103 RepID=A0A0B2WQ35_METAS|nr:Cytochrome P450 [Metarhizium album ARSEF 1941]KHN96133.1 Cytochrome P450 [Metarhizium album ARSEF 1941]
MQTEILVPVAAAAFLVLLYKLVLQPALLSPLAKIPTAHWSCSLSNCWILRVRKRAEENETLFRLHLRHGPIVRVAPNTLSVDGVDALRAIYQGGFEKSDWYKVFDNYGVPHMFSTLGYKEHSRRKRIMSNVYSKSYIHASAPARAQNRAVLLGRLLPLLRQEAAEADARGTEVQSVFMATTMDLISSYIFGMRRSTNFIQDKTYRDHWLRLYLSRHRHHFWPQELPGLTRLCTRLGIRLYPSFVDAANEELRLWNKSMCDETERWVSDGADGPCLPADEAVVFEAMHAGIDREEQAEGEASLLYSTLIQQRSLAVASEVLDQLLAGHETAGIVLTYIAWRLSRSPDVQHQLRAELLSAVPRSSQAADDGCALPEPPELDALPVLNAVVMETLRLHAPIPGPQPRCTPRPGCQVGGYDIPGGVRIASLAHTLHLDERVYPDARRWDHARWLAQASDAETRKLMNRHFWAFGSGGRMCIGSNFALAGIKSIVAVIYANFTTSVVDDDGMEQTDGYSSRPAAEQLYLKFAAV